MRRGERSSYIRAVSPCNWLTPQWLGNKEYWTNVSGLRQSVYHILPQLSQTFFLCICILVCMCVSEINSLGNITDPSAPVLHLCSKEDARVWNGVSVFDSFLTGTCHTHFTLIGFDHAGFPFMIYSPRLVKNLTLHRHCLEIFISSFLSGSQKRKQAIASSSWGFFKLSAMWPIICHCRPPEICL